jgi:hypothetical protein
MGWGLLATEAELANQDTNSTPKKTHFQLEEGLRPRKRAKKNPAQA